MIDKFLVIAATLGVFSLGALLPLAAFAAAGDSIGVSSGSVKVSTWGETSAEVL
jgi:hypothetical protein